MQKMYISESQRFRNVLRRTSECERKAVFGFPFAPLQTRQLSEARDLDQLVLGAGRQSYLEYSAMNASG